MVMLNVTLRITQIALLATSFISWGNRMIAFSEFMRNGSIKADSVHSIELNQHGSIVYITEHQSHVLTMLTFIAFLSFITALLVDLYRRKKFPATPKQNGD